MVSPLLFVGSFGLCALLTWHDALDTCSREASSPSDAAPTGAKESATFKKVRPAVGDKEKKRKQVESTLKGDVTQGSQKIAMDRSSVSLVEKTEECLEVRKQECVKLKVSYAKDEERSVTNGKSANKTNPNQGKAYLVVPGKNPTITREDGSAAPAEEIEEVEGAYDKPPRNAAVLDALPDTVSVGDSLDALARVFEAELADEDDKPKAKVKIVVQSIGELDGKKIVTLGLTATLEGVSPKAGQMKLEMRGTLDVLVDGARVVRSSVGGPMSVELPGGVGTLRGSMKETSSSSFSR